MLLLCSKDQLIIFILFRSVQLRIRIERNGSTRCVVDPSIPSSSTSTPIARKSNNLRHSIAVNHEDIEKADIPQEKICKLENFRVLFLDLRKKCSFLESQNYSHVGFWKIDAFHDENQLILSKELQIAEF